VQLRRLLAKPESTSWVASFVTRWLGIADAGYLAKDQTVFPSYTPSLSVAVAEESQRFIADLLTQSNGSLETLFTANFTLSNAELGAHYGLGQAPSAWEKVTLPAGQRLGVLAQPAFLVATSKSADSFPIRRGKTLRTRILCGDVPPPPADLNIVPVELDPNLTTRERFVQHQQAGSVCATCHSLIDPLGFAFENYDATGAYRTMENNKPIDPTGEIKFIAPEIDGPFANALEFTQRIAPSQVLKACVARESLRWSLGRATLDTPPTDPKVLRDQAIIQGLATRLATTNSDIRELLVAVVLRDEYGFARTSKLAFERDRMTMFSRSIVKRRELLLGLGSAGFLAIPVFRQTLAEAQGGVFPVRFIPIYLPACEAAGKFSFANAMAPLAAYQADANSFTADNGAAATIWGQTAEPHAAELRTLLTNDSSVAPEENASVFAKTDSIDQIIAAKILSPGFRARSPDRYRHWPAV